MQKYSMTNETFTISIQGISPFVLVDKYDDTKLIGGIEANMLFMLRDYFNFSTKFINIHDNYGKRLNNGSWTGMIGQISRNEIDFGIAGTVLSYDRFNNNDVSFLYPHWYDPYTYCTLQPMLIKSHDVDIILHPFEQSVWLLLFLSILSIIFVNLLNKLLINNNSSSIIFGLRTILYQPYDQIYIDRLSKSLKFLFIIWSLSIFIIDNSYVSYLHSFITIPPKMATIDTIDQLHNECLMNKVELLILKDSFVNTVLSKSNNEKFLDFIKCSKLVDDGYDLIPTQMLDSIDKGIVKNQKQYVYLRTKSGCLAAQWILGSNSIYIPPESIDHESVTSTIILSYLALPTSNSFEKYRHSFNKLIGIMRSNGFFSYWLEKEKRYALSLNRNRKKYYFEQKNNNNHEDLTMENLSNVFYIYLIGIIISFIVFLMEIIWKFYEN